MEISTLPITALHVRGNRFDLLSRMAEDLAHEIKNPLHAMVINLELARRRAIAGASDAVLQRIDLVENEVGRVHNLIGGLIRLMRPPAGDVTVAVESALDELRPLVEAWARPGRVSVAWNIHLEGTPAYARIAPQAFEQAVLNVVANAFEAMRHRTGRLEVELQGSGDEILLDIRDSGPGFAAEAAANFGVPGYSTRPGGTGLGTAVARYLLEADGGRLDLLDPGSGGSGATVRIALRRADPA
ncbi:MAG TPA: HAMP domain-containing sensor histidine kinase [Longimicrobiales bacterium]|nr:HAMP domain-containing sensor histidine kinase [Longimicrobiales bacterium]